MRLGQLSRKINISHTQIIEFLNSKNQPDIEGKNSKLTVDQIVMVTSKFIKITPEDAADSTVSTSISSEFEGPPLQIAELNGLKEDIYPIKEEPGDKVEPGDTERQFEETINEPILIKAPKIELAGLKIVGKIDLPEPKQAEVNEEQHEDTNNEDTVENPEVAVENTPDTSTNSNQRTEEEEEEIHQPTKAERIFARLKKRSDNPVVEARRKRERAEKRKIERIRNEQKEARRLHYQKNHAILTSPEEPQEAIDEIIVSEPEPVEEPKSRNWFVRLWRSLDAE